MGVEWGSPKRQEGQEERAPRRGTWLLEGERALEADRTLTYVLERRGACFGRGEREIWEELLPVFAEILATKPRRPALADQDPLLGALIEEPSAAMRWRARARDGPPPTLSALLPDRAPPGVREQSVMVDGRPALARVVTWEQGGPATAILTRLPANSPLRFEAVADAAGLTPNEREVARLILCGKSDKEIAYVRGLSIHTVKSRVKRVLRRVGARNRTEFAARFLNDLTSDPDQWP